MIVFFGPQSDIEDIRGRSLLPPSIEAEVDEAARRTEPVLITAPWPTADWIARLIYLKAASCAGPFRVVDTAEEETSFGDRLYRILHEPSASSAPGMLFIRDISTAGWAAQLELKRWIDDEWLGSQRAPRLVVSTSVPLSGLIAAGQFDRSLQARLNAVQILLAGSPH